MSIIKGGGGASSKLVLLHATQNNNFSNYQPVYVSGGVVTLARANSLVTMGWGILTNVTATEFDIIQSGIITATTHGLGTSGTWLYVSEGSAGVLTSTPPTIYSNPLVLVYDVNTLIVFPYQASKITPTMLFSQLTDGFDYSAAENSLKVIRVKNDRSGLEAFENSLTPTDPFYINDRTSNPDAPTTGRLNIFSNNVGGRGVLTIQDKTSSSYYLQSALWQKSINLITPSTSTTISTFGGGLSSNGTVTTTTVLDSGAAGQKLVANYLSAATNGAEDGISGANYHYRRQDGFFGVFEWRFPDADYGSGATGFRGSFGFASTSNLSADSRDNARLCFAISTNLNETNWMVSSRNDVGGTEYRVSTGMAFVATHIYRFHIYMPKAGNVAYWQIDDLTVGTSQTGSIDNSVHLLPVSTVLLRWDTGIATLTTTARNIQLIRNYVEKG